MRIAAIFSVTALLIGCSQPAAKPNPSDQISVTKVWSTSNVVKTNNKYLRLKPVVKGGKIFTANANGNVYALDAKTGDVLWRNKTSTPISSGVSVSKNNVFVGTAFGNLIAFDQNTGGRSWFQSFESGLLATPAISRGVVATASMSGQISAYRASNGHLLWNQEVMAPALALRISGAAAVAGNKFIVPLANGQVAAYNIDTGLQLWRQIIAAPQGDTAIQRMVDVSTKPLVVGSKVFVAGYQGYLAALAISNGHLLWHKKFSTYSGMTAARGALFTADKDGNIFAVAQSTGRVIWKQSLLNGRWAGAPAYCNGTIFVGDGYGYLYGLRASDGRLVYESDLASGPIIAAPVVVGNNIFVASTSGSLIRLAV